MAHTPGPWTHNAGDEPEGCSITIEKDGAVLASVLSSDEFPCLADDDAIQRCQDEAVGNASIMAAAPELLEACKRAEFAFRVPAGERLSDELKALELLRAAIAKAKGQPAVSGSGKE